MQTLTAAVECLTKQNQVLEEQLCQKVANDTQEEDQEGANTEWRDQEGPAGSNAPSRPERQNMSLPSLTNVAQPSIVAKMQAMKEHMEVMMNALKG